MNVFTFDELYVNQCAEFLVKMTEDKMNLFLSITGDVNPMHVDREYVKCNGGGAYKDVLVYGLLVSSFYSTLAGVYLPGKYCLLHKVETQFCSPVFIGDELKISGKIIEKNDNFKQITIKAEVRNQDGKKVNRAKIIAGILR